MKKVIVAVLALSLLIFSGSVIAQDYLSQGQWEIKAGIDSSGELENMDIDRGFSIAGEYKFPYTDRWTLGGGLAYQMDREVDESGQDGEIGFVPFYGLAQYDMANNPYYLVGHLGFNSFRTNSTFEDDNDVDDTSGGLYYALGAGMEFGERYTAEMLYSVNNGEIEYNDGDDEDVEYDKFTISVGMKF